MVVINNSPGDSNTGSNGMFNLVAMVLLIIVVVAFLYYVLPYLRGTAGGGSAPQLNVPQNVDVNIQKK